MHQSTAIKIKHQIIKEAAAKQGSWNKHSLLGLQHARLLGFQRERPSFHSVGTFIHR